MHSVVVLHQLPCKSNLAVRLDTREVQSGYLVTFGRPECRSEGAVLLKIGRGWLVKGQGTHAPGTSTTQIMVYVPDAS